MGTTMSRRSRAALLQEMSGTMQTFMARAVLYQAAVAKSIGLNASDLQCIGLLMSQGPATAGELAERT
ncbi:MAG: MarR family transcriptional regulator, partial [Propionibacteriales bacterium]|nr:MarR family transcriptional regulator [Propionibacteriales bacterium]